MSDLQWIGNPLAADAEGTGGNYVDVLLLTLSTPLSLGRNQMPLLNYTTSISYEKTLGEITGILVRTGATSILMDYDGMRRVSSISFKINTENGLIAFQLPLNLSGAKEALNDAVKQKKLPRRYYNDTEQAMRVGWRILKDWLEAQLALIEMGIAKREQVFLPYAQNARGVTVFEYYEAQKFGQLQLTQ
jgi:hypothetical protein